MTAYLAASAVWAAVLFIIGYLLGCIAADHIGRNPDV